MDDVFQRKTVRHFSREIMSIYYALDWRSQISWRGKISWRKLPVIGNELFQLAWEDLVKEVTCDRKRTVLSLFKDLKQIYG